MDISIEGDVVETNLDIFNIVGHDAATSVSYSLIAVQDGSLDITITATQGNALVSGIYVQQSSNHFAHAVIKFGM